MKKQCLNYNELFYSKDNQQELIDTQKEYIKLLHKHIRDWGVFLETHGIRPSKEDFDKGIELRDKIKRLYTKPDKSEKDCCPNCGTPLHFALGSLFCPNMKCSQKESDEEKKECDYCKIGTDKQVGNMYVCEHCGQAVP